MSNDDDKKSSISFDIVTYWLQGRVGDDWQNLESQEKGRDASMRFKALRDGGQYDELRLIEATLSAITKETYYRTVGHYISDASLQAGYEPASDADVYGTAESEEPGEDILHKPAQTEETPKASDAEDTGAGASSPEKKVFEPTAEDRDKVETTPQKSPWPTGESIDHTMSRIDEGVRTTVFGDNDSQPVSDNDDRDDLSEPANPAPEDKLLDLPEFLDARHEDEPAEQRSIRRFLGPVALVVMVGAVAAIWMQIPQPDRDDIIQRLKEEWKNLTAPLVEMISYEEDSATPVEAEVATNAEEAPTSTPPSREPITVFVPPQEDQNTETVPAEKVMLPTPQEPPAVEITSEAIEPETTSQPVLTSEEPSPPSEKPVVADVQEQPTAAPEAPPTMAEKASEVIPDTPTARLAYYSRKLAWAINDKDGEAFREQLDNWPEDLPLERATFQTVDQWGAGDRSVMDHALLSGDWEAAAMLAERKVAPSPHLVHQSFAENATAPYSDIQGFLLDHSMALDSQWQGATLLSAALSRQDGDLFRQLLAHGADPGQPLPDGRSVMSRLRETGDNELLAAAVAAQFGDGYSGLMFGLDWQARLDSVKQQLGPCKPFGSGLTACQLIAAPPYPASDVAIAQFDEEGGGKLVAIQIDSQRLAGEETARTTFDQVLKAIEDQIPDGHVGFASHSPGDAEGFFSSLSPTGGSGAYFAYWSDQDRRRPVFIHASLNGLDRNSGYYRILIGNPFHRK